MQTLEPSRRFDDHMGELAVLSHEAPTRAELFGAFAAGVADALSADLVQLLEYVPDEGAFVLQAGWGLPEGLCGRARVPAGLLSQAGRAMLDPMGRPVELEDLSRPRDWSDDELVRRHGARSGVAVKIENGARVFGALGVFYGAPRRFSPEERRFLTRAAALLGSGVKRLEGEEEVIAWRSRAELLRAGAALLKVPAERDELLSAAALSAVDGSPPVADWCFADALEGNGALPKLSRVEVGHADGDAKGLEEAFWAPLAPNAPHGAPRAYATRSPELVARIDENFSFAVVGSPCLRKALAEIRPYSYLCVPVLGAGRFHGALGFLRTEAGNPTPYDRSDLAACSEFAALVGAAIEWGMPRPDVAEAQEAVRSHFAADDEPPTERERELLGLIAEGVRLADIKARMRISYNTVRSHKKGLVRKLGLQNRPPDASIIAEARRRGWLDT